MQELETSPSCRFSFTTLWQVYRLGEGVGNKGGAVRGPCAGCPLSHRRVRKRTARYPWSERIPLVGVNVRLIEDATKGAYRDFTFLRHDGCVDDLAGASDEFDMAAFLSCFDEPGRLDPAFDLSER